MHEACVANAVVANNASNAVANKCESDRVEEWRRANRDRYNERMRDYMRRKRASEKPA